MPKMTPPPTPHGPADGRHTLPAKAPWCRPVAVTWRNPSQPRITRNRAASYPQRLSTSTSPEQTAARTRRHKPESVSAGVRSLYLPAACLYRRKPCHAAALAASFWPFEGISVCLTDKRRLLPSASFCLCCVVVAIDYPNRGRVARRRLQMKCAPLVLAGAKTLLTSSDHRYGALTPTYCRLTGPTTVHFLRRLRTSTYTVNAKRAPHALGSDRHLNASLLLYL